MSLPSRSGVPPAAPMTREAVDHALSRLRPAYDRIAAAMFALDGHPGLTYLRGSGLTGTTAKVAGEVQQLITLLWAQYSALRQPLEEAKQTRAARSRPGAGELATLTTLLREPVVALGEDDFPFDGPGTPARRVTVAQLAHGLETATAGLGDLLTEVDTAISTVVKRLAVATSAVGEVKARAAGLPGEELGREADPVRLNAELDELRALALADPIEVTRDGAAATAVADRLRRLDEAVATAGSRLAELEQARDRHDGLLTEARAAVEEVVAAQAAATAANDVVRVKIANPGLPEVPDTASELRARVSRLEQLAEQSRWSRFADELAALDHETTSARAYAVRLRGAADGLMERRTELRGRLDAYRAKAARLGLAEHPVLTAVYREAHDLLYTSPCDLPGATRAVFRFQQTVADLTGKESGR